MNKMKIMKKIILMSCLLVSLFSIGSCYKEDALTADLDKPKFKLEDSENPSRHYVYDLWQQTGTYVLEQYDTVDYKWNISHLSSKVFTLIKKENVDEVYPLAINYLKEVLFDNYDISFIKKYFPPRLFLAAKIDDAGVANPAYNDMIAHYGRSYLAIGKLEKEDFPKTDEVKFNSIGMVNATLWAYFIFQNRLLTLPEAFYVPCEEYYGQSMAGSEHKEDINTIRKMGFWNYNEMELGNDYMLPDKAGDIADFVELIITHSQSEMFEMMKGFDVLKMKYNILLQTIEEATGVNLQDIGNKISEKYSKTSQDAV